MLLVDEVLSKLKLLFRDCLSFLVPSSVRWSAQCPEISKIQHLIQFADIKCALILHCIIGTKIVSCTIRERILVWRVIV